MTVMEDGQTHIIYEAIADPSGMVPHWMVNWVGKWIPHKTIQNMRNEVKRVEAYRKSRLLVKYLFNFDNLVPNEHDALKPNPSERAQFEATLQKMKEGLTPSLATSPPAKAPTPHQTLA